MNANQGKQLVYLIHRWTGIAMCVLMAMWSVSGIVMLFVGYPKLTPAERLAPLPPLARQGCCVDPGAALAAAGTGAVRALTLTSIGGVPHYVIQRDGAPVAIDARTGVRRDATTSAAALAAGAAFVPGASARNAGTVHEDRWTHARALDAHRPLHVVELDDAAATRVYVSSSTGQVVLDAPRGERWWNVAGAWLHWLYMLKNRPVDPVWTWTLIAISAVGVLTAVTGIVNGIRRWRFRGRYKNGMRTPYRDAAMRWHHLLGLVFGAILSTWIFSGLMSMNPAGIFDAQGAKPDAAAMAGGDPGTTRLPLAVDAILAQLANDGFAPRELEWRVLAGQPFVLARDGANATRIVVAQGEGFATLERWPAATARAAAARALPYPIVALETVERYDAYYYRRDAASMYGGNERCLPALRATFGDPAATWLYVDLRTGQLALSADRRQRAGRWLFNLLHSWDLPALLDTGWLRLAALILLGAGGALLSATAAVIGWRRLGTSLASRARGGRPG